MVLTSLSISNFRSYKKASFSFSPSVTYITGANTLGKTNVLEAIYMLATGKSFRIGKDQDCISWGSELAFLSGNIQEDTLEIRLTRGMVAGVKAATKRYMVNGVARRLTDYMGILRVVVFSPEDLELVSASPSSRRHFLDAVLMQSHTEYRRSLIQYEHGIRQRNKVLERIRNGEGQRNELLYWNDIVVRCGEVISVYREKFLTFASLRKEEKAPFSVFYDASIISTTRLLQYKDEEIAAASTLVGPHRDDFVLRKDVISEAQPIQQMPVSVFGSRGEQRLSIVFLKMAELAYIANITNDRPVLLLDDIFSELDSLHRQYVLHLTRGQQTIITSAEEEMMLPNSSESDTHISLPLVH